MRVTQNTNFNTVRDTIARTKGRMEKFQEQASTMRKLNSPADNPIGASKVLEVRTDKVNNDQFSATAKLAESYLNQSDHALAELADVVLRAKEIAIGQASGASSTDSTRLGVSEEVTQLFQRAIATANTRIGDRYLFGGYKTDRPPVDPDGRYIGDDGQMMVEIAKDVFLSMNVPGLEAFNTNPRHSEDGRRLYGPPGAQNAEGARAPASKLEQDNDLVIGQGEENVNVFDELQNLRISLLTGDLTGIRGTLDRFDQIHDKLISTRAKIGARVSGLQSSIQTIDRQNITNAQLTSTLEDADMSQVMTDLAKEETVLRSVLSSSQRLVQPSLMDFLR